jgi:TolB-like protein
MLIPTLWTRLKDRKLVQWALAYLAAAFGVLQVMDALAEPLSLGGLAQRAVLTILVTGFFVTLVLAWFHGEKGRQSVGSVELGLIGLIGALGGGALWLLPGDAATIVDARLANLTALAELDDARPRIAVLPLTSLSADEADAYFAAGVHDELVRVLSMIRDVGVVSRTSTLRYANTTRSVPEIAVELGARYIVEGTVQRAGARVRVQVQLIDPESDQLIWGGRYDESLDDVFAVQGQMARAIAGGVQAVVTPDEQERLERPPTQDPLAYDIFLRAAELDPYDIEEYETLVALLRRATSLDTAFAVGHARLSEVFITGSASHGLPTGDSSLARAETAVRLDPDLPPALMTRGWQLGNRLRFAEARISLERALSIDPGYAPAWGTLAAIGWWSLDFVQGALAGRQGARLDRGDWRTLLHLANNLGYIGMYRESEAWSRRLFELDESDPRVRGARLYGALGMASGAYQSRRVADLRRHITQMRAVGSDNVASLYYAGLLFVALDDPDAAFEALSAIPAPALSLATNAFPTAGAFLGWSEARSGRESGMERLRNLEALRLQQHGAGRIGLAGINDLSVIASVLHDEAEQLRWFREAVRLDPVRLHWLKDAPYYDGIRDHPEFQAWLDDIETRQREWQREMAALGPWMPEEVMGAAPR